MPYLFLSCFSLLGVSCSVVPDLSDPAVFTDANQSAVDLSTLERKFMYGMFHLWVDEGGEPFTGWAKSTNSHKSLQELGYLKEGRKEGLWISWDENKTKVSEIYWTEDRMNGSFLGWHENGRVKVTGQTNDGEVDGEWSCFYKSGQIASRSINQIGHLVEVSVWKPDGSICEESNVIGGNGSFLCYFEDGSIEHKRIFEYGVETSREIFDQR
jgi:antitoxin component YwqK of YwqJK toxin-antitoxin module